MFIKAIVMYFFLINSIGFIIMGIDKRKSQKFKWRIKETKLFFIAIFGGALGIYFGMKKFHHKTQKPTFKVGIPILTILNLVIYIYFCIKIL
ncbi:MAG: DUF1294 domain-containing protein [Clostridiales bacterium]|nr:DUF1294 domain-containing protein [Clostridiales bacterium]